LPELATLDDAGFRALFRKSSIKRIGRDRFLRNVMIAIGNSGNAALADRALAALDDGSAMVRGAAIWALSQLLPQDRFRHWRATKVQSEPDAKADDRSALGFRSSKFAWAWAAALPEPVFSAARNPGARHPDRQLGAAAARAPPAHRHHRA
jgi:hypothetical protein